jgi:hypothetical protein
VTLLLPFTVLMYYLATCQVEKKRRWFLIGALAAVVLLMILTGTGIGLDRFGKLAQVYGAYVWAFMLLIAAMVVMLRHQSAPAFCEVQQFRVAVHASPQRKQGVDSTLARAAGSKEQITTSSTGAADS